MSDAPKQLQEQNMESPELLQARQELHAWRAKVEQAEQQKSRLVQRSVEQEQEKQEAQEQMKEVMRRREEEEAPRGVATQSLKARVRRASERRDELMDRLRRTRAELEQRRNEARRLNNKSHVGVVLPQVEVEFVKAGGGGDDVSGEEPIRGQFFVRQQGALLLRERQGLLTFEDERVARQVLQIDSCSVSFDDQTLEVKPKRIRTEPTVQFEVHLSVSRRLVSVQQVVSSMPQDSVERCLALSFSRLTRGGGEVQSVTYDPRQASAQVAFIRPGVAEWLALRGEFPVDLDIPTKVKVSPVFEHQLHKFQMFCGAPKRSVLLDVVTGGEEEQDEEEVQDQLEIHFQKPSNGGGEIEHTKYCRPGTSALALLSPDH